MLLAAKIGSADAKAKGLAQHKTLGPGRSGVGGEGDKRDVAECRPSARSRSPGMPALPGSERIDQRPPARCEVLRTLLVPVRKVGISGIGAGGKRPRSISQEAVRRTKNSSRPLRASTDRSLPRPRGSVAAAGPPVASRRARSGAGCCNRSGAMADSGVRPAWDAGEPGASGCGRTPPIGRRP